MLGCLGDLVEDVVVVLGGAIHRASDTTSEIHHRRGGSAANVAATAARLGHPARFIGQVGDDPVGDRLVAGLRGLGVDVVGPRGGRTGTVVALVEPGGERTMLSDRGASVGLDHVEPAWLDGLHTLHVPFYSLAVEPLATAAADAMVWVRKRSVTTSVDLSSVSVLEQFGVDRATALLAHLRPDVVLANADEAALIGPAHLDSLGAALVVVKRGSGPARLTVHGDSTSDIDAIHLEGVVDTTGAGDAFAAGFLVSLAAGGTPQEAVCEGHAFAASTIVLADRP